MLQNKKNQEKIRARLQIQDGIVVKLKKKIDYRESWLLPFSDDQMTRRYPYPWLFWTKKKEKNENGEGKKKGNRRGSNLGAERNERLYNYAVNCCLIETLKFQYLTVGIFFNNEWRHVSTTLLMKHIFLSAN